MILSRDVDAEYRKWNNIFPGEDKSRGAESGWSNMEIEGVIFRPSVNSNVLDTLPVRHKLEAI